MRAGLLVALMALSTSCMVGPKYKLPPASVPQGYKEPPPPEFKEWKRAEPMEGVIRGQWWQIYHDPALSALEDHVAISNQNVLMAEAQYRQAQAAIKVARAALFPTLTTSPSASYARGSSSLGAGQVSSAGTFNGGGSSGIRQNYTWPFDFTWEVDIWGGIRRNIAATARTAQATEAQLENARLSYQASLAENYFSLHGLDARQRLLEESVKLYSRYLELTQSRFRAGVASEADVALAETQLATTRAQLIDVGVSRSQFEHAVAILIGKPPADVTIPIVAWTTPPPTVPVGIPSQLLERRPDVAAAERRVAAANEQIGVAKAAYYPTLTLTGSGGFQSSRIGQLLNWPSRFWSLGPQLAETILDFGRRRGALRETEAAYDATVAAYRETVLEAFQQVEDNLAALRILEEEAGVQDLAVRAAQRSLEIATAQYRSGVADYLQVITSQTTLLDNQISATGILTNRMLASVRLVQALGGGWDVSELP